MGNLLSYSGISAKIRAMQSKLTTEEQFQEIIQCSSGDHLSEAYKGIRRGLGFSG